ncbi:MAG: Bug family tripartite tricarboxylate transporter substrate binding protein [Burkholderiales bacterium]
MEIRHTRFGMALLGLAVGLSGVASGSFAQPTFPSKPIRMIVPIVPGGSIDLFARRISQRIGESFGQPVVVENIAGAAGSIGANTVARAAPDGYTLMYCPVITVIGLQFVQKGVTYDPIKDFTPIMAAVEALTMIVAHPTAPGNDIRELLAFAKKNPGKLTFASAGVGSYFHLLGEILKRDTGTDILHVPYKGAPQALTDVATGQVHMTFISWAVGAPFIGRVKVMASMENMRLPGAPNAPSLAEFIPGYEKLPSFFSFHGPGGMPRPILMRIHGELLKALNLPETRAWLEQNGTVPIGSSPEELAVMQKKGMEAYAAAVKIAGVKPD